MSALLLGCFADFGKVDPRAYGSRLTDLFMDYSSEIVERVVHDMPLTHEGPAIPPLAKVKNALSEAEHAAWVVKERDKSLTWAQNEEERWRKHQEDWHRKHSARPETMAAARKALEEAGVAHLPENHPDRREAFANWFVRAAKMNIANPQYPNMAAGDPNRLGAPKGWTKP